MIARSGHTSTLLQSGKILVVGGATDSGVTDSAEIYDPEAGAWTNTAPLSSPRAYHTATRLDDGSVLVAGGYDNDSSGLDTAERFDPLSETWVNAGEFVESRAWHTATLLADGRVLLAGGYGEGFERKSTAIYDSLSASWQPAANMTVPRKVHSATKLDDGRILVAGGISFDPNGTSTAEIYDPANDVWTQTASMNGRRHSHVALLLPDGRVMVVGGDNGTTYLSSVQIFNATLEAWVDSQSMPQAHRVQDAALLNTGEVAIVGGRTNPPFNYTAATHFFDPDAGLWFAGPSLMYARYEHRMVALQNGDLLVTGGASIDGRISETELFQRGTCSGDGDCFGESGPSLHIGPSNVEGSIDNCLSHHNPEQLNEDGNHIDHSPPYSAAVDDKTRARSDSAGDACDDDDDNDGILDADELDGGAGCAVVTDPLLADTDGDRYLDGAECALGTDPTSAASKPLVTACGATTDADGDKLTERVEFCFYGTDPNNSDTDGDKALDGAVDGCEAASMNGDRIVNVADMGMLASAIANITFRVVSVDVNKDGAWNPADQGIVASFISPGGQCPG